MRSKNPEKMKEIMQYIKEYMIENHKQPTIANIASKFHHSTSTIHAYIKEMNEKGMLEYQAGQIELPMDSKIGYEENTAVLLDNNASCGPCNPEEQNISAYINLPARIFPERNLVVLTAKGDSMEDAGISENDLLFVETETLPKKGEIVVALDDEGETQVKRLKGYQSKTPVLAYENREKYPNKLCDKKIVAIQGVVRHILKHC